MHIVGVTLGLAVYKQNLNAGLIQNITLGVGLKAVFRVADRPIYFRHEFVPLKTLHTKGTPHQQAREAYFEHKRKTMSLQTQRRLKFQYKKRHLMGYLYDSFYIS